MHNEKLLESPISLLQKDVKELDELLVSYKAKPSSETRKQITDKVADMNTHVVALEALDPEHREKSKEEIEEIKEKVKRQNEELSHVGLQLKVEYPAVVFKSIRKKEWKQEPEKKLAPAMIPSLEQTEQAQKTAAQTLRDTLAEYAMGYINSTTKKCRDNIA